MTCERCKRPITWWERVKGNYYSDDEGAILGHKHCPKVDSE